MCVINESIVINVNSVINESINRLINLINHTVLQAYFWIKR